MKVLNVHSRNISKSKEEILTVLATLSTSEDKVWPLEKWPRMKFKEGLTIGAHGGHGPIRYFINSYEKESGNISFTFTEPSGFNGTHTFTLTPIDKNLTELKHIIKMKTSIKGTFLWVFAVRWLHDALIEDLFDKVENNFGLKQKTTPWSFWVKFLRYFLK